ncbi:MAG: sulfatase-like hydrolase/transferase [Planctomycetes bacterium]|nr:sulfatase-like hydrolase/transferase [Planctomycetota bacterium]
MKRRASSHISMAFLLLVISDVATRQGIAFESEKPNLVFIFIDDMGYGDLSCTGNQDVQTTNLDKLAAEGIRLTQFYVNSPICSPSRVACTTGQYPARHLINSYLNSREKNQRRGMANFLDPEAPCIARAFQQAGYATAHFGKWHMGGGRDVDDAPLPQAYGFDESLVSFEGLGDRVLPLGGLSKQSERLARGEIQHVQKHEMTSIYVDRSIEFIQRNKDRSFYLHLWLNDVHDGHNPSEEQLKPFENASDNPFVQKFYAVLANMDRQLGRVIKEIDRLGLGEETLIVVTSDNGPTAWPRYENAGCDAPGSTAGMRGRKWSLYEGGIRMPLIARWKGKIPAGVVDGTSVMTAVDLFPTFCGLANVAAPTVDFDGVTMAKALLGKPHQRSKPIMWEYGRDKTYLQPARPLDRSPNLAIRDGKWKLLVNDDGSGLELYDLSTSNKEYANVAGEHVELAKKLSTDLLAWRRSLPVLPEKKRDETVATSDGTVYTYRAGAVVPTEKSPPLAAATLKIAVEITANGSDGAIVAQGGSANGFALYVQNGKLNVSFRVRGEETRVTSDLVLPSGRIVAAATLANDGKVTLLISDKQVGTGKASSTIPNQPGDGLEVGRDVKSPVGPYEAPFAWSGTIHEVKVTANNPPAPSSGHLVTRWAGDVDPNNVLPEYPRPQMVRDEWLNLNGHWQYAIRPKDQTQPKKFDGRILVPYPIESILSGVQERVGEASRLWYRRTFTVPEEWTGPRTLLHFGAVDWKASVWVNGKHLGDHQGGYDPFSFDITDALRAEEEQELVVSVWDPTDAGSQPRGKQVKEPRGIWYTPVTGIWQTVWLEPVPDIYIRRLKLFPDIDSGDVSLDMYLSERPRTSKMTVRVQAEGATVAEYVASEEGCTVPIRDARLWSPDDPFLYDVTIETASGDRVKSYFGMRSVSMGKGPNGFNRLLLNNEPVFQYGPLDQGWWPDGLYTAPTDEALRFDIEMTKKLGFNMARKHVKVEPARWYHWCDRIGLLVWQDLPSGFRRNGEQSIRPNQANDANFAPEEKVVFRRELKAMIDALYNSPSIVAWVPFNEGWGQHDTNEILQWTKQYDQTRLIDGPSGWQDRGWGEMKDMHRYPGPSMFPAEEARASVLGEFGGLGLPIEGHTWVGRNNWGYRNYSTRDELGTNYERLIEQMPALIAGGLAAAIYTQTTDVEIEVNGLMTYDRSIVKFNADRLAKLHAKLYEPPGRRVAIAPTSENEPQTWRYTTTKPSDGWQLEAYDDSQWKTGESGFGTKITPNTKVRTEWKSNDIWIRRSFTMNENASQPSLRLFHDEDAAVFINGTLAAKDYGYVVQYIELPISDEARKSLRRGENTIAVHCRQTGGGQYIDVGVVDLVPASK